MSPFTGPCQASPWQRPARPARADAEHSHPDAAAGGQRGRLHQLSRQRREGLRDAGRGETGGKTFFRVFDSLNWVENMRVAMDAVVETGRVCEGTICYTGDLGNPDRANRTTSKYYVSMAKDLEAAGAPCAGG